MKKILSVFLAVIMVMTMSVTAFAETTTSAPYSFRAPDTNITTLPDAPIEPTDAENGEEVAAEPGLDSTPLDKNEEIRYAGVSDDAETITEGTNDGEVPPAAVENELSTTTTDIGGSSSIKIEDNTSVIIGLLIIALILIVLLCSMLRNDKKKAKAKKDAEKTVIEKKE